MIPTSHDEWSLQDLIYWDGYPAWQSTRSEERINNPQWHGFTTWYHSWDFINQQLIKQLMWRMNLLQIYYKKLMFIWVVLKKFFWLTVFCWVLEKKQKKFFFQDENFLFLFNSRIEKYIDFQNFRFYCRFGQRVENEE